MALFRKKQNDYQNALEDINSSSNVKSSDRIIFEEIHDDSERSATLVDQMKLCHPLVINFESLTVTEANKLLAFFSGAAYAIDGKSLRIREKVFMFARNQDFLDGSLDEFIKSL